MKIADFGLARGVHHIDYYKKTSNVRGRAEMHGSGVGTRPGMEGIGAGQLNTSVPSPSSRAACQSSGWLLRPCLIGYTHTRVMCESGNWVLRCLLGIFFIQTIPLKGPGTCQSHKILGGVPLIRPGTCVGSDLERKACPSLFPRGGACNAPSTGSRRKEAGPC